MKNNARHSGVVRNPEIQIQTKFIVFDVGSLAVMNRNRGKAKGNGCLASGLSLRDSRWSRGDDGFLSLDGTCV
ncbi:MAG: hypothetical protein COB33_001310 [Thiotrichaceae bacterium]|nr:hypothetical protein [Thiotrichaceae bacterium]PCI12494.1 MAG: hypothetical protein COB71_08770 [Thiotrichales bacterium]